VSRGTFSTSNFLRHAAGIVTAAPLTMAAWCWTTINNEPQHIIGLLNSGAASARNCFRLKADSTGLVGAETGGASGASQANTSASYPTSTWFHAAAVYNITSGTDRAAFLNGGNKGTQTTDRTPSGINRTSIGFQDNAAANQPFGGTGTGDIALPAIWNTNLSDAEVALLAAGIPPWRVRPENLVACWPLLNPVEAGDEANWWPGNYLMSEQGTLPAGPHNPPVVLPFPWLRAPSIPLIEVAAGAPAFSQPAMLIGL